MAEDRLKQQLNKIFNRSEFKTISGLEKEIESNKSTSPEDIQDYVCIQYWGLVKAFDIYNKTSEVETQTDEMSLCKMTTSPLFHGLINYTNDNECFNEAPDRNNLAEYFNLGSDMDIGILDKSIIHFLVGTIFFEGIGFRGYGRSMGFSPEDSEKIKSRNIEDTIAESKQILDNCLDRNITYEQIEKSLYFLAYRGEFDYIVNLASKTLPLEKN